MQAVENFQLTLNEVRRIVLNGFWASFNPWRDYEKKKEYIQKVMAYYDAVEHKYGFHRHAELRQACALHVLSMQAPGPHHTPPPLSA
jgi:hypothetical protein